MLCDDVLHLLRLQRGLLATRQLCAIEPDRARRRTIYESPDFERASPRVLRHRATPWTIEQELMLGVLDAGANALLWGKPAACHWGFGRFPRLPAHVAVPRGARTTPRRAQIHAVRHLDPSLCALHDDIPIARPEVVILWLAGMWTHRLGLEAALERTAVALDHAWRQRLIDGRFLHHLVDRSGGKGRSGIVAMRAVLEDRPPSYKPAGSRLEERFEDLVGPNVRSLLRRQVTVDVEPVVRTVDYELTAWPLIVEINGEAFHSSLSARAADSERYQHLMALGFSVAVFWEYDVWHDQLMVQRSMRQLIARPDEVPTLHRPTKAPWEW